ncbi:metal dependent phosphohydrolase [Faunimonas pinastri]|uniref:Metal dependent phosphohydrolase n=1 Tax=Faunimonas pinastri TaxID=1855383 RepID=A0A1H8ZW02_9HYPH|nr:HD family hydrolase [Faunimonas pinastri]SEP68622.1 metal dependent phosphohydrolase [Faunimonas pinastri]
MSDRRGAPPRAWQRMLSGRRLDLLDPSPFDIEIADIAHGLARVARWNGQTSGDHAFSVAQHSLVVERILSLRDPTASRMAKLAAMLHDAPEYVIGDMISPFKAVLGEDYKAVERRLLAAIHIRYGLPTQISAELTRRIKKADRISAYWEAVRLAGFASTEAVRLFGNPDGVGEAEIGDLLDPWPAKSAESLYLDRFAALVAAEP